MFLASNAETKNATYCGSTTKNEILGSDGMESMVHCCVSHLKMLMSDECVDIAVILGQDSGVSGIEGGCLSILKSATNSQYQIFIEIWVEAGQTGNF